MAALGFSLNNISLFGLVLAIGIVVDDAIVVLENIERLMATGLDAAHRHHQGDGRGHRPDRRRGPGAVRRVRAVRLHQRHHRPVLPPVRRDHRRLDGDLGHQRRHHDAFAGRADLQGRAGARRRRATARARAKRCPGGSSPSLGGLLTVWLARAYADGRLGLPAVGRRRRRRPSDAGCLWAVHAVYFLPVCSSAACSVGSSSGR